MVFKVEKLEENVHLVRAYRKKDAIKYCFVCTLHKTKDRKKWQIKAAMSSGFGVKTIMKVFRYLKNYPSGVYSYVSKEDFERFYKRFCKKIDFDNCDF